MYIPTNRSHSLYIENIYIFYAQNKWMQVTVYSFTDIDNYIT